jgi:hypothetical protein
MVQENASKGKNDPSRFFVQRGAGDTSVGDRGGLGGLPGSADTCSWRGGAGRGVLQPGNPSCNSAVPDHSGGRSRKLLGIHRGGKLVAAEPARQVRPHLLAEGAGQWQPIMAAWIPASLAGDPLRVAISGTLPPPTAGSHNSSCLPQKVYTHPLYRHDQRRLAG